MTDCERAKALLDTGDFTCVLCRGDTILTSTLRGVAPMLSFLSDGIDLRGFSSADKVVGKAAAMLFVLAGVDEVYARIMSAPAVRVFDENGVKHSFETLSDGIVNRSGTGACPMEAAVADISEPSAALEAICRRLAELNKQ